MSPLSIVEHLNKLNDGGFCSIPGSEDLLLNQLKLQRSKEAVCDRITPRG
jgi:hypothetical protein